MKLTKEEREIEKAAEEYVPVSKTEFKEIAQAIARKRKKLVQRKRTTGKALEKYRDGKITLSEAAHRAGVTARETERRLVKQGYRSAYSVKDLERESRLLRGKQLS